MMIEKRLCFLFLVFILLAVLSAGCIGQQKQETPNSESPALIALDPKEYFPMTGKWSYRIELGETIPLLYRVTENQILRMPLVSEKDFIDLKKGGSYYLTMKVQSHVDLDSGNEGAELRIIEDDLDILMKPTHFAWVLSDQEGILANQIAFYDEGVSLRPIFFLPSSGDIHQKKTYIVGEEDSLRFVGLNNRVPGCENQLCMHFIREVLKGSGAFGYTDNGFIEHSYFAEGKGLVYFVQTVNDEVSMTWTLDQFSPR